MKQSIFVTNYIAMKFNTKLNEFDVLDLLNEYHSELRKLKHKLSFVKDKIEELEAEYEIIQKKKEKQAGERAEKNVNTEGLVSEHEVASESVDTPEPGSTKGVENETVTKSVKEKKDKPVARKGGRKKKSNAGRKQEPPSMWDQMILDSVLEKGKPAISREILERITAMATEKGIYEGEEKTKVKLNQCLVKLTASNRKALVKIAYKGRGHAYAFPKWVNKQGELLEAFKLPE